MLWGYKPIVQLLGLFDGGLTPFFCHRMGHLMMNQWRLFCFKCFWEQTRSRRELRSRCFCEFSTWAMHKIDNPYRVSVFSLKNHHPFSMVFAWLWGYEFAVLPMFSIHVQHTCLKKTGLFCFSTWRPSQPASSTCLRCPSLCDKQTQTRSLGWIHSHLEWAYGCCTAPWAHFLKRLPLPIYTLHETWNMFASAREDVIA